MNKKIILWLLVLLVLTGEALALGLRPAKTTLDFKPDSEAEYSFWVVNNDNLDFKVNIYVEGELGGYIQLKEKTLNFKEDDDAKEVRFKLKLPKSLPSGEVKGNIIVEEVIKEGEENYGFTAKLILKHKLTVNSPYPEKYVEGKLSFEEKEDKINLISEVKNLGTQPIEKIKTRFYVNDNLEELESTETKEESLNAGETKKLTSEISRKKISYGEFNLLAYIIYDNYQLELEKKLISGEPEIEILFFDQYFIHNKINQFTIDILNKWNKRLERVFFDIFVFKEGKQIDQLRTSSFDLEGKENKKVEGYFDATNKELGEYEFNLVANYGDKKTSQKFKGTVLEEAEYEKARSSSSNLIYILIGILFGLVIIIFGVLLWYKKGKEKLA